MLSRTRSLLLLVLTAALCATGLSLTAGSASAAAPRTTIKLKVKGCDGCEITAVQTKAGSITYSSASKTVANGKVRFSVPTKRTKQMSFLVYAEFDDSDGLPLVPITQFKGKKPGTSVSWGYARKKRTSSGCWTGTSRKVVRNTLVVKKVTVGDRAVAGAYMKRGMKSGPVWYKLRKASFHPSDPSICP